MYKVMSPTLLGAMPYEGIRFGTVAVMEWAFPKTNRREERKKDENNNGGNVSSVMRKLIFGGAGGEMNVSIRGGG